MLNDSQDAHGRAPQRKFDQTDDFERDDGDLEYDEEYGSQEGEAVGMDSDEENGSFY